MAIPRRPPTTNHDNDDGPGLRPGRRWLYGVLLLPVLLPVAVLVSIVLVTPPLAH
jgi:hypothetical protein